MQLTVDNVKKKRVKNTSIIYDVSELRRIGKIRFTSHTFYNCVVIAIRPVTKADRNDFSLNQGIAQALHHARSTTVRAISFRRTLRSMQIDFFRAAGTSMARIRYREKEIILRTFSITIRVTGDFCIHARSCNELAKCTLHGVRSSFIFEIRILLSQAPHSIIRQQFVR